MSTYPVPKHEHKTLKFPENFLWGSATSSFQVEGNNTNTDWWQWELQNQPKHRRSGTASDQYNKFDEDFKLAKSLGQNSHRCSIEWARVEPKEGVFDETQISHYKQVLKSLKDKDFTVMLTLWHFTLPIWVAQQGGWENGRTVDYFIRFLEKIVPELKDSVDLWITLNEPVGFVLDAYQRGKFPPCKKNNWSLLKASINLVRAHKSAYKTIHQLVPYSKVGIAHSASSFEAFHSHNLLEQLTEWLYDVLNNHLIFMLTGKNTHDFLGLNYYFNNYISLNSQKIIPQLVDIALTKKNVSDLGWEIFPPGIFNIIMDFSDYHKPIYITENGIASTNDDRRVRFLISYLQEIYHAIQSGVEVKGYFYWSLIDNYEWVEGFGARFGLVDVDFDTQKRTPKPSAYVYKEIIQNNGIPHYLLKLLGHTIKVEEVVKIPRKA